MVEVFCLSVRKKNIDCKSVFFSSPSCFSFLFRLSSCLKFINALKIARVLILCSPCHAVHTYYAIEKYNNNNLGIDIH